MDMVQVTFRTPTRVLFQGDASALRLKTDLGRMEILPGHATLLGTILHSKVYIRHGETEDKFIMNQGSVSVDKDGNVRVLADEAHKEEELSVSNMREYLEHLVEQMKTEELNDYQMKFLQERRAALQEAIDESDEK